VPDPAPINEINNRVWVYYDLPGTCRETFAPAARGPSEQVAASCVPAGFSPRGGWWPSRRPQAEACAYVVRGDSEVAASRDGEMVSGTDWPAKQGDRTRLGQVRTRRPSRESQGFAGVAFAMIFFTWEKTLLGIGTERSYCAILQFVPS